MAGRSKLIVAGLPLAAESIERTPRQAARGDRTGWFQRRPWIVGRRLNRRSRRARACTGAPPTEGQRCEHIGTARRHTDVAPVVLGG